MEDISHERFLNHLRGVDGIKHGKSKPSAPLLRERTDDKEVDNNIRDTKPNWYTFHRSSYIINVVDKFISFVDGLFFICNAKRIQC